MFIIWCLSILGAILAVNCSENPEIHHYSPPELVNLIFFERNVYWLLKNYFENSEYRLHFVDSYLRDFEEGAMQPAAHINYEMGEWTWATIAASHPVIGFRMMHRLSGKLVDAVNQLENEQYLGLIDEILIAKGNLILPTAAETQEFLGSLLQLQFIYDLPAHEFSTGIFPSLPFQAILTVQQQIELGNMAIANGKHATGVEWLHSAIGAGHHGGYEQVDTFELLRAYHRNAQIHDRLLDEQNQTTSNDLRNLWHIDLFQKPIAELDYFARMRLRNLEQNVKEEHMNATELCNRNLFHGYSATNAKFHDPELECWYHFETDPYLFISPFKVELLSANPYLLQIHDFAGDELVVHLLDNAIPLQAIKTVPLKPFPGDTSKKTRDKVWPFSVVEGESVQLNELSHKCREIMGKKISQESPRIHGMSYMTKFGLHDKALSKVFQYLDSRAEQSVRLVCHEWNDALDTLGHRVCIDDRLEGNEDFGRRANIRHVKIMHVDNCHKNLAFKNPALITYAHCTERIEPSWFFDKLLKKCKHLRRLDLDGKFLITQELSHDQQNGNSNPFHDSDANSILPKVYLPCLKTLQIIFDSSTCRSYLDEREPQGRFRCFGLFSGDRSRSLSFLRRIIDRNVAALLHRIRSPVLSLLYIFVDPMQYIDPGTEFEFVWKGAALEEFLYYHRNTLKKLYLPYYNGKSVKSESTNEVMFPAKLTTFELTLADPDYGHFKRGQPNFMDTVLLGQTQLEEMRLEKPMYENRYQDKLHFIPIVWKNYQTLKYLSFTLNSSDTELLNGKVFANCSALETFILSETPDACTEFTNLMALPKSLRRVQIWPTVTVTNCEELEKIKKFTKLESILLCGLLIVKPTCVSETELAHRGQYALNFIMDLLHLRQLDEIVIDFIHALKEQDNVERIQEMVGQLLDPDAGLRRSTFEQFHTIEICGLREESDYSENFLDCPASKRGNGGPAEFMESKLKYNLDKVVVASNIFTEASIIEQVVEIVERFCSNFN